MLYLTMLWDLCAYRSRKRKLLKTIRTQINETVLNEATFYIYLDLKGGLGKEYARLMLKQAVHDMILDILAKKGVEGEFYTEGYPKLVDEWANQLVLIGNYPVPHTSIGHEKFVFHRPQGERSRFIFFLVGDGVVNRLEDNPYASLELSNLLFDLLGKKCAPGTHPVVFADGNRMVNLFALKNTG